jgi:hypothetical protein
MATLFHFVEVDRGVLRSAVFQSPWSPAVVFAIAAALSYSIPPDRRRIPWKSLSACLVLLLVATAGVYLFLPVLFEETEAGIAAISAGFLHGRPIYHAADAAQRYSILYGPLTYLSHIPFYLIFGTNLVSFKLLGVLAFLTSMIGLYRICRGYASARPSLVGLGAASVVFFRYLGIEFWGRIDPLILCLIVICIWTILEAPPAAALFVNAVAFAAVPNLKLSGAVYLIPVFAFLVMRMGWLRAGLTALAAALLFPLPFLVPGVSLRNYVFVLEAAGKNGLNPEFLLRNAQYSIILLVPAFTAIVSAAGGRKPTHQQWTYLMLTVLCMALSSVAGAKNGAGSYHLIPYVVPILHFYFWMGAGAPDADSGRPFSRLAIPWVFAMMVFSVVHVKDLVSAFRYAPNGRPIVSEIRRVEAAHPGQTVEVGFGETFNDRRMEYVYVPPFDGQPYTFSASAVKDLQLSGVAMAPATLQFLERCETQVWLIPKGDRPFTPGNNYYDGYHAAFDGAFQSAFLSHYRKTASLDKFDVWSCGLGVANRAESK